MKKQVRPVAFHIATLPLVVEIQRARRGQNDGGVVITMKAGAPLRTKRRPKR